MTTSNTGDQIDTLIVQKIGGDTWSPQLCRVDGVCGGQLTINSVSPGNTAYIELRLAIPADASTGQSGAYQIVARSEGSGNTIMSETVTVTVTDLGASFNLSKNTNLGININNLFNIMPEWKYKALNSTGEATIKNAKAISDITNLITFNGRYSNVTYDGSHFSQLGMMFNAALTVKF